MEAMLQAVKHAVSSKARSPNSQQLALTSPQHGFSAKWNLTGSELKENLNFLKTNSPLVLLLLQQPTLSSLFAAKSVNNNGSHLFSP